jgi:hypothetical protein
MSNIITDLYQQLFGRKGIADGNVIDMAEHGRVGGVSTGQPFKFTRKVDEKVLIDEVDSATVYIGKAKMGASTSDAVWQIQKIVTSGTVIQILYADGDDNYDKKWDDRTTLTYS